MLPPAPSHNAPPDLCSRAIPPPLLVATLLTPLFETIIFPQELLILSLFFFFTLGKLACETIGFHRTLYKFIYLVASQFHAEFGKNVLFFKL